MTKPCLLLLVSSLFSLAGKATSSMCSSRITNLRLSSKYSMKTLQHFLASFLFAVALAPTDRAADNFKPEPGFVSLFNGKDLSGWCYSSDDKFDGKRESSDARYSAKEGVLTVHSVTPRRVSKIWTTQEFPKNFVLRIEFRAEVNADSGIYLRSPQLQCRDYLVAGPYKKLKKYRPQDWNEIEVVVKDGVARCMCNGEVLEEALKLPSTGPIGLEGDRGQMEYRHIRLKELP